MCKTIADLPNKLSDSDIFQIKDMIFSNKVSVSLYDEKGNVFERGFGILSHEEEALLKENELTLIELPVEIDDEENISQDEVYSRGNPIKDKLVHDGRGYYTHKVVSLKDYHAIPRGELFEVYKSELDIAPILIDGNFNFKSKSVESHLVSKLGIIENQKHNFNLEQFKDKLLIWHPGTGTYLYYDAKQLKYEVYYQRSDFSFDSLDLALAMPFDWAMIECGYGWVKK